MANIGNANNGANNGTNTHNVPTDISLEYIRQEKKRIKQLLDESEQRIKDTSRALVAQPKAATTKREQIAQFIGNAYTIFDGVMIGLKITRRLRQLFGK